MIFLYSRICVGPQNPKSRGPKSEIAKLLEQDAKAPRVRKFKFPKPQAIYFTYLVKKYGDNYKVSFKATKAFQIKLSNILDVSGQILTMFVGYQFFFDTFYSKSVSSSV